jgi:argininosuccinate synthase
MRIVLAYGGGLSGSAAIPWLRAAHHAEIIAVTLDLGQGRELEAIRDRALMLGAQRAHVLDARESFARDLVVPALRADALHGGHVPMALALSRPAIAGALVEIAGIEGADAIAHASRAGVDTRLHRLLAARAPSMPLLALAQEWSMTPADLDALGRARGLATESVVSRVDANLWGRSSRQAAARPDHALAPRAPEACPDEPAFVDIAFAGGAPAALNGVSLPLLELIASLGTLAATHGVGYAGTDDLQCFAPAAVLLHAAHRALIDVASPAGMERFAADARAAYVHVVEGGLWFSPLREGLDAFFAVSQARLDGHVRLRLCKGEHATIATELSPAVPAVTAPGDVLSPAQH